MLWLNNCPIIPIGYVRHSRAISLRGGTCKFTAQGGEIIHKTLDSDVSVLLYMMKNPIVDRSVEYNDNRISKYTAQKGKCFILGTILLSTEIHCHHIETRKHAGTYKFQNLVIVHKDIHTLIHTTSQEVIERIIRNFHISEKQMLKINELRNKVKNGVIKV